MKLLLLEMKNFRGFVDQKVQLANKGRQSNSKRNVTLFIGDNSTGKTTLSLAINWCLFGNQGLPVEGFINSDAVRKINIDDTVKMAVTAELDVKGTTYILTRSLPFIRKPDTKNQVNGQFELNSEPVYKDMSLTCKIYTGQESINKGGTGEFNISEVDEIINQIVPREMREFIFYDGERLTQLSNDFESKKSSKIIRSAINTFLGLETLQIAACRLIGPIRQGVRSVLGFLNNDLAKYNDPLKKDYPDRIQKLNDEIANAQQEKHRLEVLRDDYHLDIQKCRDKIRENENAAIYQADRDAKDELRSERRVRLETLYKEVKSTFARCVGPLLIRDKLHEAIAIIQKNGDLEYDIPSIRVETIDWILKHGICLCGEKILPGSVAEKNLIDLKKRIPPNSIKGSLREFLLAVPLIYQPSEWAEDLLARLECYLDDIDDVSSEILKLDTDIQKIDIHLAGKGNFESWVKSLQDQINNRQSQIDELNRQIGRLEENIATKTLEVNTLTSELQSNRINAADINFLNMVSVYINAAAKKLNSEYSESEKFLLGELNKKVQSAFQKFTGLRNQTLIDDRYVFNCRFPDGGLESQLSGAMSTMAVFSVITAVIELGKESLKNKKGVTSAIVDSVPIIMDAPMSKFDEQRKKTFGELFPGMVDQLIISSVEDAAKQIDPLIAPYVIKRYKLIRDTESSCRIVELS